MHKNLNNGVVLVDENDRVMGFMEKYKAHKVPVPLHRAISVVIFDKKGGKMLLQKRSEYKPTWPLHWSNTCCSHPYKDESYFDAANRRLKEEMGFSAKLKEFKRVIYKAEMADGMWGEHEFDVVFTGNYEGNINPDPKEAVDIKWMNLTELKKDISENPNIYTPWFKLILQQLNIV